MSPSRLFALALVSLAAGAATGATVTRTPSLPDAAVALRFEERLPPEAPVRAGKQARLDAGCGSHAWPYIPAQCLQRVAAMPRPAASAPTAVTIAKRDPEARLTTLVKVPVLRTASR